MNKKVNWKNLVFIGVILLLLIPQTRQPIQVTLQKGLMLFASPSVEPKVEMDKLEPFVYKLESLDGISSHQPIGNGKVTFVSYWATWCPPCIAEMPSIDNLYKDYRGNINFLLITNEEPGTVKRFMDKKAYEVPVYISKMAPPEKLASRSIPASYIIDQSGNIVVREKGALDWNSPKVRKILDALLVN